MRFYKGPSLEERAAILEATICMRKEHPDLLLLHGIMSEEYLQAVQEKAVAIFMEIDPKRAGSNESLRKTLVDNYGKYLMKNMTSWSDLDNVLAGLDRLPTKSMELSQPTAEPLVSSHRSI